MDEKLRYGQHFEIHVQPFQVDRTNLFTGRVEYHSPEDWDRPDSNKMSLSFGPTIVGLSGIGSLARGGASQPYPLCVGVERRYDTDNSMAIYSYTFEGIAVNHGQKWIEFELEFTMNQQPIETHPNFESLNEIYGHYDAINRIWPIFITEQAASVGLQSTRPQGGAVRNPMYGVSSYLEPGLTYRISYTDIDVDQDFLMNIGTIVIPPKFGEAFPQLQSWITNATPNRNWLKLAPKIRQHGSCIAVTEEYMLSGYRGWLTPIYSAEALGGTQL